MPQHPPPNQQPQFMSSSLTEAETPGFGEYFAIFRKRSRLLLLVGFPIVAIAGLLAVGLPDTYRSQGQVELEGAQNPRNAASRDPDESPYADQYVQSLGTVVLSDRNLGRLLQEHKLYDDQDADPSAAVDRLRRDIDVDIVTVPILDPETGREREVVSAFSVAYDNRSPQRAQLGAAWLVDAYLTENRRDRQGNAASTAKFFANEAERMRARVADLEAKLAEFKSRNPGQSPDLAQVNMTVMDRTENDINNIETQLQALRRERVFLQAQLAQAQASGPETNSIRALEDEYARKSATYDPSHPDLIALRRQIDMMRQGGSTVGQSLRQQLQTQRSILAETQRRYSADHPDVKRIMRNIETLEGRIASGETSDRSVAADSPMAVQVTTQINATDTQIGALMARAAELRTKMSDYENRVTAAPQVEREFQIVTRDLTSARTKYEELLKRQMDAEVSEAAIAGGTNDRFRVKASPTIPEEPARPQRLAIFAIGVVLAMIAGMTSVVVAQLFDQTVRGARDIREILDVAPLTAVPVIQRSRSGHARKGHSLRFAASAAVGIALIGYVAAHFIR